MISVFVQQIQKNSLQTQTQIRKFYTALLVTGILTACTDTVSDSREKETQQQVNKLDNKKSKKQNPDTEKLSRSLIKQKNKIEGRFQKRDETRKKISELIGLTPNKVVAFLGPPNFIRRDSPSEFWRYQNHSCKLVIFLFDSENKNKVTFAAINPIGNNPQLDDINCLEITK